MLDAIVMLWLESTCWRAFKEGTSQAGEIHVQRTQRNGRQPPGCPLEARSLVRGFQCYRNREEQRSGSIFLRKGLRLEVAELLERG